MALANLFIFSNLQFPHLKMGIKNNITCKDGTKYDNVKEAQRFPPSHCSINGSYHWSWQAQRYFGKGCGMGLEGKAVVGWVPEARQAMPSGVDITYYQLAKSCHPPWPTGPDSRPAG